MIWKCEVSRGDNGYIIKGKFGNSDEVSSKVIQDKEFDHMCEDNEVEINTMQDLLLEIKEYFGVYYSKHNKKNLIIKIEGGEKDD